MAAADRFKKGQSGNPGGRAKGQHSPQSMIRRVHGKALKTVAEAAERGDLEACIATILYNKSK